MCNVTIIFLNTLSIFMLIYVLNRRYNVNIKNKKKFFILANFYIILCELLYVLSTSAIGNYYYTSIVNKVILDIVYIAVCLYILLIKYVNLNFQRIIGVAAVLMSGYYMYDMQINNINRVELSNFMPTILRCIMLIVIWGISILWFEILSSIMSKINMTVRQLDKKLIANVLTMPIYYVLYNFIYFSCIAITFIILKINFTYHTLISQQYLISLYAFFTSIILIRCYFIYRKQLVEKKNVDAYIANIEETNFNLRRVKHNYLNILTSMYGYIEDGDIERLKSYFYKVVDQCRNVNSSSCFGMTELKELSLKSLLAVKMKQAKDKEIDIEVYCEKNLSLNKMNICDLCEILGVFLDNAIEESGKIDRDKRKISVSLCREENGVNIVIKNSYLDKPNLSSIYIQGYSTKGENRGIGLATVKAILEKYGSNTLLNTLIDEENESFIQELCIK